MGNAIDKSEGVQDDAKASFDQFSNLLTIPTYQKNWLDNLEMNLTYDEGQFLKNQITTYCKGSMLAHILENNMQEILEFDSIRDLKSIIFKFPEQIQKDYEVAMDFSEFVFVLRVIYNLIVSDNNNERAIKEFNLFKNDLKRISDINVAEIMVHLNIKNNKLKTFLEISKQLMANDDIEGLKEHIKRREIQLKGTNRARLCHPGEYDSNFWFAGDRLNYRFDNVKVILRDIFESEKVMI